MSKKKSKFTDKDAASYIEKLVSRPEMRED